MDLSPGHLRPGDDLVLDVSGGGVVNDDAGARRQPVFREEIERPEVLSVQQCRHERDEAAPTTQSTPRTSSRRLYPRWVSISVGRFRVPKGSLSLPVPPMI